MPTPEARPLGPVVTPAWRRIHLIGLLAVAALALLVRALGFEYVFVGDEVVFPPADPQYHLRRALYTFSNFPAVLLFDPYINYPGGASVPWPPLFDFTLGAVGRLLARDVRGFEALAAWAPPVLGMLCTIPIYGIGRRVASPGVGLLAGLLFAFIPISVNYTRIGNADHHCAVALIGAWLLYLCVRLADPELGGRRLRRLAIMLGLCRLVLLLTWHGSLLYLALAEACLLLTAVLAGRPSLLLAQASSAFGVLLCVALVLMASPTPLLGDYSSIALSWLHVSAMIGVTSVAGGAFVWERARPASGPKARLLRVVALAAVFVVGLLSLPGPRQGLVPALQFLSMTDDVGQITLEQTPLFSWSGRSPVGAATRIWGYLAYLIPLAPLSALWLAKRARAGSARRAEALVLAGWGAFFATLALLQRRYGNDFAPVGALLFSAALLGLGREAARRLSRQPSFAGIVGAVIALCAALLLLWPALSSFHWPRARGSLAVLLGAAPQHARTTNTVSATLSRFSREVRRATPDTAGYLSAGGVPEYGIISNPNLGHALQYGARRATATDPFWAYIGYQNWDRSMDFLSARREAEALSYARELQGRYVVTQPLLEAGTLAAYLHEHDGVATPKRDRLVHFRLVTESLGAGRSIGDLVPGPEAGGVAYKLFEIVEGAVLEVEAQAGSSVVASVLIRTPRRREFVYRATGSVGEQGTLKLRLPYSTDGDHPTRARRPYEVRVEGRSYFVGVPELAVVRGGTIRVDASSPPVPSVTGKTSPAAPGSRS